MRKVRIRKQIGLHVCTKCRAALTDSNFTASGILLKEPTVFFEFDCPTCHYKGRYTMGACDPDITLSQLVRLMKRCFFLKPKKCDGRCRRCLGFGDAT